MYYIKVMDDKYLKTLGENIKLLRTVNKLTLNELAAIINVSNVAIHKWEQGLADPTSQNIVKLANTFNITTDELLGVNNLKPFNFEKINRHFTNTTITEKDNKILITIEK